jgi:hypothetical protein
LGIGEDVLPEAFCLSDNHAVSVGSCLLRDEGGMKTSQDNRYPALLVLAGYLIGAPGSVGFHGNPYEIHRLIVGDRLDAVIVKDYLVLSGGEAGEDGEGKRLHPI